MITVSIILTTYNSAKSLPRLLKSILQQKGLHSEFTIEWLVVDDCSTDQTCAILEQFTIPYHQTKQNSGGPNKRTLVRLKTWVSVRLQVKKTLVHRYTVCHRPDFPPVAFFFHFLVVSFRFGPRPLDTLGNLSCEHVC